MLSLLSRTSTHTQTFEKIHEYLEKRSFAHVVSLNPENIVIAYHDKTFRDVCARAQVLLVDGVGTAIAGKILSLPCGERVTGVDLMKDITLAYPQKKIMFVGGKQGSAQKALEYLSSKTPRRDISWVALSDIDKEDPNIINKIVVTKPEILFLAFGSPFQELWVEKHKGQLNGVLCMGVGQGFDVYAGIVLRAPNFIRKAGFEWLYRLITQPWRWRRQLRLLEFVYLVMRYRFGAKEPPTS